MNPTRRNSSLLSQYDPFSDMDQFFGDFFRPVTLSKEENRELAMPRVDIEENGNSYMMKVDLPGVAKDDIDVSIHDGVLTIQTETNQEEKEEKEGKVIRRERHYGQYIRHFKLGENIDEENVQVAFTDGVLKLELPKVTQEKASPRKLNVN